MSIESQIRAYGLQPMQSQSYAQGTASSRSASSSSSSSSAALADPVLSEARSIERPDSVSPSAGSSASSGKAAAAAPAPTDDEGFTFWDALDIVNPLQHIPIVSTVYREVSGDQIGAVARLAGGALFGGPIGLALAGADYAMKETTGAYADEHVVAALRSGDAASPSQMAQDSRAPTVAGGTAERALKHGTVTVTPDGHKIQGEMPAPADASAAAGTARLSSEAQMSGTEVSGAQVAAASSPVAAALAPVSPDAANASKFYTLNRARDVRPDAAPKQPELAPTDRLQRDASGGRKVRGVVPPATASSSAPSAAASNAAGAPTSLLPESGLMSGASSSSSSSPAVVGSGEASASAATLPLGLTAGAAVTPLAMQRALQAQGLRPQGSEASSSQNEAAGAGDQRPSSRRERSTVAERSETTSEIFASKSALTPPPVSASGAPVALMPLGMIQPSAASAATGAAVGAQAERGASSSQAVASAEGSAQAGTQQMPTWFDNAMKKAMDAYQKTGRLPTSTAQGSSAQGSVAQGTIPQGSSAQETSSSAASVSASSETQSNGS